MYVFNNQLHFVKCDISFFANVDIADLQVVANAYR